MIDLASELVDLADHLDHPTGGELAADVRRRIASPPLIGARRSQRARLLVAIAAVVVVIAIAVLAIPTSRQAIADWLGIGAVDILRTNQPPASAGSSPLPGRPGTPRNSNPLARLAAAQRSVQFRVATPGDELAGALFDVEVDRRPLGGLVVLAYERFTVVEVASTPNAPPQVHKSIGPNTHLEYLTVHGRPAAWIVGGTHWVSYFDPAGNLELDTVRRSGPVLLWERGGVTYRIEGIATLSRARTIAESIG